MDSMEDSGFDSDPKPMENGTSQSQAKGDTKNSKTDTGSLKSLSKKSDLQRKLERQREAARKSHGGPVVDQPRKTALLARNRLLVPNGKLDMQASASDIQPLVMLDTDDSDDEFGVGSMLKTANKDITQQLIKDGYNLDLEPDDEDLDLIPPRPVNERCICCPGHSHTNCVVQ